MRPVRAHARTTCVHDTAPGPAWRPRCEWPARAWPHAAPARPAPARLRAEFKQLKTRRKHRFLVMTINEESFELAIETIGEREHGATELLKALPPTASRYAVFDHEMVLDDGRRKDKLYFITWTPHAAKAHSKMLYSSQKGRVVRALPGVDDLPAQATSALQAVLGGDARGRGDAVEDEDDDEWDPDED